MLIPMNHDTVFAIKLVMPTYHANMLCPEILQFMHPVLQVSYGEMVGCDNSEVREHQWIV